jgi:hypothetical protein
MERSMPPESIHAHLLQVSEWMTQAAAGLARHFNLQSPLEGVALLRRSYALMVGLWQLLKPEAQARVAANSKAALVFRAEYAKEVNVGLFALWAGTIPTAHIAHIPLASRAPHAPTPLKPKLKPKGVV